MIINRSSAQGADPTVAHVFGGPRPETDSSKAVTSGAAVSVTLTEGQLYRLVADVDAYFAFQTEGEADVDGDTGSVLIASVPEVFRCPDGRPVLSLLGTGTGTVWVNRQEI